MLVTDSNYTTGSMEPNPQTDSVCAKNNTEHTRGLATSGIPVPYTSFSLRKIATNKTHFHYRRNGITEDPPTAFTDFMHQLREYGKENQHSLADLISGSGGKPVLMWLYQADQQLALTLLSSRVNRYTLAYRTGGGTSDNEQELHEIQRKINILKGKDDQSLFQRLLENLSTFERVNNRIIYEDRCQLALLQDLDTYEEPMEAFRLLPKEFSYDDRVLLDPDNISAPAGALIFQSHTEEITDMIAKICTEEGNNQQDHRTEKCIDQLIQTGKMNLKNKSARESVEHLVQNQHEDLWEILDAYFCELEREDSNNKNPLHHKQGDTNKSAVLKTVLAREETKKFMDYDLVHYLSSLQEDALLEEFAECEQGKIDQLQPEFQSFFKQAEMEGYTLSDNFKEHRLTVQTASLKKYISQPSEDTDSIWIIEEDYSEEQIASILNGKSSNNKVATAIQLLQSYINASSDISTLDDQKKMLIARDELIKAQIEYFFAKAGQHLNSVEDLQSRPELFNSYMKKIILLENSRPSAALMMDETKGIGIATAVSAAGKLLLRAKEEPVQQRLRDLHLEYQLKYHFQYDYATEVKTLITSIPKQMLSIVSGMIGAVFNAASWTHQLVTGKASLIAACRKSMQVSAGMPNSLLDYFKQSVQGYEKLCENNPHMARVLAGNIAQTATAIKNAMGEQSEFYALFDQLNTRVSAEAATSYMTAQFDANANNISSLSEDEANQLKKVFTLCRLLKYSPEIVTGTVGTAETIGKVASGNVCGAVISGVKTVVKTGTAHLINHHVSALSDDEVKSVNAMIMTIQHGPVEAAKRLQIMQASAEFTAEQLKGKSVKYSATKAFFRPLTIRFTRFGKALADWRKGENSSGKLALFTETIKLAGMSAPVLFSAIAAPMALWLLPALAGSIAMAGPLAAIFLMRLFYQTDPVEDLALIVKRKLDNMMSPRLSGLEKMAETDIANHMKSKGYQPAVDCLTHLEVYDRYIDTFRQSKPELAGRLENELRKTLASDEHTGQQINKLNLQREELTKLEVMTESLTIDRVKLSACIPADLRKQLAEISTDRLPYWIIGRIQEIHENFFQSLGTDTIPASEEALTNALHDTQFKVAMVNQMKPQMSQIAPHLENPTEDTREKVKGIGAGLQKKAYEMCLRTVMKRALITAVGNENITSLDQLDQMTNKNINYQRRLNDEIELMKNTLKAGDSTA